LHTTFQQNKDCNLLAAWLRPAVRTWLHTTFQQNKDCNYRMLAQDCPACLPLHTTFQQNKDCNGVKTDLINVDTHTLHTTFQQNKDCNILAIWIYRVMLYVAYDLPAKQGLQRLCPPVEIAVPLDALHTTFQQNKDCNARSFSACCAARQSRCIRPSSKTRTATSTAASYRFFAVRSCIRPSSKTRTATSGAARTGSALRALVAYDLPAKQGLQPLVSRDIFGASILVAYDLPAKQGLQLDQVCDLVDKLDVAYDLPAKQGLQREDIAWIDTEAVELHTTFQQNKDCNVVRLIARLQTRASCIRPSSKTRTATLCRG